MRRHFPGYLLLFAISLFPISLYAAERVQVDLVPDALLKTRLEKGVTRQADRQSQITALFTEAGCKTEEQKVGRHVSNVICTLPGTSGDVIIVGGHFDFVDRGSGIVDDWSGTAMLASLYQSIGSRPRQHTYMFIAFAAEETGLNGSRKYVSSLTPERKKNVKAFVNLECLGVAPPKVWGSRASPVLLLKLERVATSIGVVLQSVNVENIGDDDSHPFRDAHIPVLTLHSATQQNLPVLHSPADKMSAIHLEDYSAAYKLASHYLAYLDNGTTE